MNRHLNEDQISNGGEGVIETGVPFIARVTIEGSADLLFHRWNVDAVAAKGGAAKGSKAKKSDDVESYVYRTDKGELALPGEYLRQAILTAAKFRQDPRSPRKSAQDLFKAGIIVLTQLASFGKTRWDYEDKRRVMVQRSGITRVRPALSAGWQLTVEFQVILSEYIDPLVATGKRSKRQGASSGSRISGRLTADLGSLITQCGKTWRGDDESLSVYGAGGGFPKRGGSCVRRRYGHALRQTIPHVPVIHHALRHTARVPT